MRPSIHSTTRTPKPSSPPRLFKRTASILLVGGIALSGASSTAWAAPEPVPEPAGAAADTGAVSVEVAAPAPVEETLPSVEVAPTSELTVGGSVPEPAGTTPVPTAAPTPASCKVSAPAAPWRLVAVRDSADPTTATVEWAGVGCATRYNLSVFNQGNDTVTVLDGKTTQHKLTGLAPERTYQLQVSSRNDLGQGATSGTFYLRPATPAGVSQMKVAYNDVNGATLNWKARAGEANCLVKVKRVSDQKLVREDTVDCQAGEYGLSELDSRQMYVITIRTMNKAGEGPLARLVIGGDKPNPVKAISAVRDPGDPGRVLVSWLPSDNTGRGTILGYEVAYGHARADERAVVKDTDSQVSVPADKSVVVIVRVITDAGKSTWSKSVRVPGPNAVKLTTTDQRIDLIEQEGVVTVAATNALARGGRLSVRIEPTVGNGGFTDTQYSQEGAQTMVFRTVPSGSYLVKVSNTGSEVARKYINIGNVGTMSSGEWQTILGTPDIQGDAVSMLKGGETRVLSTRVMSSQDVVMSTRAHLVKGQGYGVWLRTGVDPATKKISGLTVQYDPGWGNKFIIRQWHNGTECSKPIAASAFPTGMKVYDEHNLLVAAQGDSLYVTIDGQTLFNVPSLNQAMAANSCSYPAPTGTRVGLRSWGTSTQATFKGTWVR